MNPLLEAHRALLQRFRGSMNLVGPGPIEPHYADCEAAIEGLDPSGLWADLGSGAGFPGIVFAARYPGVRIDLVDSRHKRCVFLREVLASWPPDARAAVRVLSARAEALPPGSYDGLLARALAKPAVVAGHAARLLVPGGRLVLLLGPDEPPPRHADLALASTRAYSVGAVPRRVAILRRLDGALPTPGSAAAS